MIWRTRKKQKMEDGVLSSGLHGMWYSDVFELYDTIAKRGFQTTLAGWRGPKRHCDPSFDNLDGENLDTFRM